MTVKRFAMILSLATASAVAATSALAQDIQTRVIKFGHNTNPGHPMSQGVLKFGELVAAKSGGKIQVKEFASSVLGPDMQQLSATQGGVQEMNLSATSFVASLVKEFSLIDLPFSVTTPVQADTLLQGEFGKALLQKLPEKNLIGLDYWDVGFRNLTNSRKPVETVEDMKGLKTRVMGNPLFVDSFNALGTNPVPMAFSEVYGALESRAIDAQENPFNTVLTSKFYEVQKYLSVTNHSYTTVVVLISKRFWDRLSATEQKIIRDSALEAGIFQRKVSREMADNSRKELESKGMKVNDVSPATIAKMRELVKPAVDKSTTSYDPAVLTLYNAELKKAQAAK